MECINFHIKKKVIVNSKGIELVNVRHAYKQCILDLGTALGMPSRAQPVPARTSPATKSEYSYARAGSLNPPLRPEFIRAVISILVSIKTAIIDNNDRSFLNMVSHIIVGLCRCPRYAYGDEGVIADYFVDEAF